MELRGHRRANKPQSGLFSRHYYTGSGRKKQAGGKTLFPVPLLSCREGKTPLSCKHKKDGRHFSRLPSFYRFPRMGFRGLTVRR